MTLQRDQFLSDLRVGVITLISIAALVLGITFAGGDKGLLLKKTSVVKARLADVGGLKKGATVTMNGMAIGKVTDIAFAIENNKEIEIQDKNQVEVTMEVRADMRNRIGSDSVPAVRTQGMLGDRYVDIPPGSIGAEPLPNGKILIGAAATDFDKTLNQALDVLTETEKLLSSVNEQKGTAGKLVYDDEFYNHLIAITNEMNELLKDFKKNPRRYIKFSVF